jgi:hypothetical protein
MPAVTKPLASSRVFMSVRGRNSIAGSSSAIYLFKLVNSSSKCNFFWLQEKAVTGVLQLYFIANNQKIIQKIYGKLKRHAIYAFWITKKSCTCELNQHFKDFSLWDKMSYHSNILSGKH